MMFIKCKQKSKKTQQFVYLVCLSWIINLVFEALVDINFPCHTTSTPNAQNHDVHSSMPSATTVSAQSLY